MWCGWGDALFLLLWVRLLSTRMALESLYARPLYQLLDQLLGPYIANLSRDKLRVGVWSGNVVFSDLVLRDDALDGLELPVLLTRGSIGRLQLRVPWSRLRSQPIELVLEDVVLETALRETPDLEAFVRRERMHKRLQLDAEEVLRGLRESAGAGRSSSGGTSAPSAGFFSRFGRVLLDNLRLTLINVHVRVNAQTTSLHGESVASAWGMTLQRFEMSSTDSEGQPEMQRASSDQPWLYKLVVFAGLAAYWRPLPSESGLSANRQAADDDSGDVEVLPPTNFEMHFRLLRAGADAPAHEPRTKCTCRVQQKIDIHLSVIQCAQLLQASSNLSSLAQRERYGRFRMQLQDTWDGKWPSARALWRYALQCIEAEVGAHRRWSRWPAMRALCCKRREYLSLWSALQGGSSDPAISTRLLELEDDLDINAILLFRNLEQHTRLTPLPRSPTRSPVRSAQGSPILPRRALAPRGVMPGTTSPRTRSPPTSPTKMLRSASDGMLAQSPRRSSVTREDAKPTAREAELLLGGTADDVEMSSSHLTNSTSESCLDSADRNAESGNAPASSWRGWLWRRARGAGSPDGVEEEEGAGYEPLSLSQQQQQHLGKWMHSSGIFDATELPLAQIAPTTWSLDLSISTVAMSLMVDKEAGQTLPFASEVDSAVLTLSQVQHTQTADLEGNVTNTLQMRSLSISTQMRDDPAPASGGQRVQHPVLQPLAPASEGAFAIDVQHEAWPARIGAWPDGSAMRTGCEAGAHLNVSINPLSLHLMAPAVTSLISIAETWAMALEDQCGAVLPEPRQQTAVSFRMGASSVLFSHGGAVLQVNVGPLEASLRPPGVAGSVQDSSSRASSMSSMNSIKSAASFSKLLDSPDGCSRQASLLIVRMSLLLRADGCCSTLVAPFSVRCNMCETQNLGLVAQETVVEVGDIRSHLDMVTELPQLWAIMNAFGAASSRALHQAASPPSPAVPPSAASDSSTKLVCNLVHIDAMIGHHRALLEVQNIQLGTASRGPSPNSSEATFQVQLVDLDLGPSGTVPSAIDATLRARLHTIFSRQLSDGSEPLHETGSASLGSVRVSVARTGSPIEAFVFEGPATSEDIACSISTSSEPSLRDVAITGASWRAAIQDAGPCVGLINSVTEAAKMVSLPEPIGVAPTGAAAMVSEDKIASAQSAALAMRLEFRDMSIHTSVSDGLLSMGTGVVSAAILCDRAGGKRIDTHVSALNVTTNSASAPWETHTCLHPAELTLSYSAPALHDHSSPSSYMLHVGHVLVSLPGDCRDVCSEAATTYSRLLGSLSKPAPVAQPSVPRPGESIFLLHMDSASFQAHPIEVNTAEVSFRMREQGGQTSAVLAWDSFEVVDAAVERPMLSMSSSSERAAQMEVEMNANMLLVQMALPTIALCVCPVEMGAFLRDVVPMALALPAIDMPASSDAPMVVDMSPVGVDLQMVDMIDGVETCRIQLRTQSQMRVSLAGGLYDPFRAKLMLTMRNMSAEMSSITLGERVLVAPTNIGIRFHAGPRRVCGSAEISDVDLQLSPTQVCDIERLVAAALTLPDHVQLPHLETRMRTPSPPLRPHSVSESISETSEYFDAREDFEGAASPDGTTSPFQATPSREGGASDLSCELRVGLVVLTLLDDNAAHTGTPILQAALHTSRAVAQKAEGGSMVIDWRVQVAMHHYNSHESAEVRRGWHPVLASCTVDVSVSDSCRLELASRGPIEIDVSTSLLASLVRLQQASVRNDESNVAPFVLKNDTGTPMCFWVAKRGDSVHEAPTEVRPGSRVYLAEGPIELAKSGRHVHVMFKGFQQMDIGADAPPYVRRYRLWPAKDGLSGSAIVNVVLDSRKEQGTETLTFHSRFVLQNTMDVEARLHLLRKDVADEPVEIVLEPKAQFPVPLTCHYGSLVVVPAGRTAARGLELEETLEISPATLEVLAGRGAMRLGGSFDDGQDGSPFASLLPDRGGALETCYHMKATMLSWPPSGWLISLHPPLLLHNALLCELDYEISELGCGSAADKVVAVHQGRLASGRSAPFLGGSSRVMLRTSCLGFRWSQPVALNLSPVDDEDEHPGMQQDAEYSLAHIPCPGNPASSELQLCLRAVRGAGTTAEVSGRVWVVNESHLAIQVQVLGPRPSTIFVPTSLPSGSDAVLSPGAAAVPLGIGGLDALPELSLHEANAPRQLRSGAFLSLPDLLQLAAHSEDILLPVSATAVASDDEAAAITASPRLLQLGVKLLPLPQQLGSSFLLAISPRIVILNRSGHQLHCRQRGCSASTLLANEAGVWTAVHWEDPQRPRELLFKRLDRGAEWSGGIRLTAAAAAEGTGAAATLRLRNLETGEVDFLRLSWQRLTNRATSGLVVTDASDLGAPILIQNLTRETMHVKQVGVSIRHDLAPGELFPYAWDEPARHLQLTISVPSRAVRFRCDTTPCRIKRPVLARVTGAKCLELQVRTEGATCRIVLEDASAPLPSARTASPPAPLGELGTPRLERLVSSPMDVRTLPRAANEVVWQVRLQLPHIGVSLLDGQMRELLYSSVHGLRLEMQHETFGRYPVDTLYFAVASVQLDCQMPRSAAHEEVLLEVGVATRGDAFQAQLAVTWHESLAVVQAAQVTLQEITLRLDEEALDTVAAALYDVSRGSDSASRSLNTSLAVPGTPVEGLSHAHAGTWGGPVIEMGMHAELSKIRDQQVTSQLAFVQQMRLGAIPLKLSLQRASRPDVSDGSGYSGAEGSDSPAAYLLRWIRWLGITLIGLEEFPVRLPEVALNRCVLPIDGLLREVEQQYTRSLMQQAYKLLPSAALFGDPYGMLRTLRQRWHKHTLVLRHAEWQRMPGAVVNGAVDLLRVVAASFLRSTGKVTLALSSGLEALLSKHDLVGVELNLAEAALRGVGGLAREASRAIEQTLLTVQEKRAMPPAVNAVLAVCLLPFGFGRGVQRLVLLLTLGSLGWMRTTTDAFRSLLAPPRPETGRSREPRPPMPPALYSMCNATLHASGDFGCLVDADGTMRCATLVAPRGALLLTSTALRCVGPRLLEPLLWEVPLADILLVQRRASNVRLLVLDESRMTATHEVGLASEDDAARLHEILRVAGLNARGGTLAPTIPWSAMRTTLLQAVETSEANMDEGSHAARRHES